MDPGSHALPLVEDKESRDDLKVNEQRFSSTSSVSELAQQGSKTTQLIFTNPITKDGAIAAVPLSYCLPIERYNTMRKDKNASTSVKSTSKKTALFQQEYSAKWKCIPRQRKNGKWDKFYYHNESGTMCRSLKEVERFEHGTRPNRKAKEMKVASIAKIAKEMVANVTEETSAAKREPQQAKSEVETFLTDSHHNLNQLCPDQQYSSDDAERTPSPPWSQSNVIPRH